MAPELRIVARTVDNFVRFGWVDLTPWCRHLILCVEFPNLVLIVRRN